jgi:transposase
VRGPEHPLKIAVLLRGGMLPQAYVYPAGMRSTRDLLRRRLHLMRKRGQLLAHIQNTIHQHNLPAFGKRIAYPASREGLLEHFPDPSVRKSVEVDLALLERYDALIAELELAIVRQARRHDADAFHRLRSVPGIGKVLALTLLYETMTSRASSACRSSPPTRGWSNVPGSRRARSSGAEAPSRATST